MLARLLPLKGKYYGTEVEITNDNGNIYTIKLWNNGVYEPSDRELDGICTIEEWRKDRDLREVCDSHFESRETHEMALTIVALINGKSR